MARRDISSDWLVCYDLYLLCALDVPFVQDGWRDDGPHRPAMDAALRRYLRATDARWVELTGPYEARLRVAVEAVDELLAADSAEPARLLARS